MRMNLDSAAPSPSKKRLLAWQPLVRWRWIVLSESDPAKLVLVVPAISHFEAVSDFRIFIPTPLHDWTILACSILLHMSVLRPRDYGLLSQDLRHPNERRREEAWPSVLRIPLDLSSLISRGRCLGVRVPGSTLLVCLLPCLRTMTHEDTQHVQYIKARKQPRILSSQVLQSKINPNQRIL